MMPQGTYALHNCLYYAGHGIYDDELNIGYWQPIVSTVDEDYTWIDTTEFQEPCLALSHAMHWSLQTPVSQVQWCGAMSSLK